MRAGFRPREPRVSVHVPARMHTGDTWTDITILNISSRGLMAHATVLPPPRSYVEIRRGRAVTIVGKVVWQDARHFGIRTQDRISMELINDSAATAPARQDQAAPDRRVQPRTDPAEAFARSRQQAAMFQFTILSVAGLAGAVLIGSAITTVLSSPFAMIASHLA